LEQHWIAYFRKNLGIQDPSTRIRSFTGHQCKTSNVQGQDSLNCTALRGHCTHKKIYCYKPVHTASSSSLSRHCQ
jgi:hypothetical protein